MSIRNEPRNFEMTATYTTRRVLVAEARPAMALGLAAIVSSHPQYCVVGSAAAGDECLRLIGALWPDIAVVGAALPRITGLEISALAVSQKWSTRVILVAQADRGSDGPLALSLGAHGFIAQDSPPGQIHACLNAVTEGRKWLPPMPATLPGRRLPVAPDARMSDGRGPLTMREREVTRLAARGMSNKAIARELRLADGTVRIHLQNIFRKLGVGNRTELAVRTFSSESEKNGEC